MLQDRMDDFVRKPYRANEIYECLSKHLRAKYMYERVLKAEEPSKTLAPDMLAKLPETLCNELKGNLDVWKMNALHSLSNKSRPMIRKCKKTLIQLADSFNYSAILKALKNEKTASR
jgi:hypothetical protein